ncbi:MAG: hypothetical protein ACPMAQ_10925 [Phycisphaerae bacterium]
MTGFNQRVVHLYQDSDAPVEFRIEVDFPGNGMWKMYDVIRAATGKYIQHEFPAAFGTHWVRVTADRTRTAIPYLIDT